MLKTVFDYAGVVFNSSNKVTVLLALIWLLVPTTSQAGSLVTDPDLVDNHFEDYYLRPCLDGPAALLLQGWSNPEILAYNTAICSVIFNAGSFNSSNTYASSSNLGSYGAVSKSSNTVSQQQVDSIKESRQEELKEEEDSKGGWGVLLSAQTGQTERFATNLEVGYESELNGLVAGLDYRFDDQLVVGVTAGFTRDEADFSNNTGMLTTDSLSAVSYFTYAPSDKAYFDAYLGFAPLGFSSSREVTVDGEAADAFGFSGTITSDFDGQQLLAGLSGGYNWDAGNFSIGTFAVIDYSKTEVDGYDERGTTNLEMRYPEQTSYSCTSSLGLNLSHTTATSWGAIVPNLGISWVHQYQDDARAFNARLIVLPAVDPSTLLLETDDPDRDYALANLGVVLATNKGTQYFASYELMESNDFMETWAFSVGMLTEF